jgi:hypothetical protein
LINHYLSDFFAARVEGSSVIATCKVDNYGINIKDAFSFTSTLPVLLELNGTYNVDRITLVNKSFSHDELFTEMSWSKVSEIQAAILELAEKDQNDKYGDLVLQDLVGKSIEITLDGYPVTLKLQAADECFIATAAFGSKFYWPVALLRSFRDDYC